MRSLLTYLALALTISAVHAGEFQPARRDHVNLKRFIKKRTPQVPVVDAGNDPAEESSNSSVAAVVSTTASSSSLLSSSSTAAATSTSASSVSGAASTASTTTSNGGLLSDILGGVIGSSTATLSAASSSTTETSSSSSDTATTSTSTSSVPPVQSSDTLNLTPAPSVPPRSTITQTATQNAAASNTVFPEVTGAARTKSVTLMVLIIIASCIGGIAIVWTIFRKWKLGRSSKFDERLQPIDWQPTDDRDDGIVPVHRRASNASSFHSASAHGHAANGGYGTANLQPIPDHDFTAGTNTVGGYADLARGPSPQPPMSELGHGAGMGYNNYNAGVPLHHQAGGYGYQGSRY